jgi:hypothetical protein
VTKDKTRIPIKTKTKYIVILPVIEVIPSINFTYEEIILGIIKN